MNYFWIVVIIFAIVAVSWLFSMRKTKLISRFPFGPEEKIVFKEEPAWMRHKQSTIVGAKKMRNYHELMRPLVEITNKKRIIFAQKFKNDALIYGVFSVDPLSDDEKEAWRNLGYTFATLSPEDIEATTDGKKSQYMITMTGRMPEGISSAMGINDFIMQVYTNDLSEYEKSLGVKIPLQ